MIRTGYEETQASKLESSLGACVRAESRTHLLICALRHPFVWHAAQAARSEPADPRKECQQHHHRDKDAGHLQTATRGTTKGKEGDQRLGAAVALLYESKT